MPVSLSIVNRLPLARVNHRLVQPPHVGTLRKSGWLAGTEAGIGPVTFYGVFNFLGTIFLNALKMIIVPLIFSSIVVGIAGIGRGKDLGKLGGKTVGFYLFTGLLAVLIGLAYVNLVQPGYENGEPVRDQLALEASKKEVKADLQGTGGLGELVQMFVRMVDWQQDAGRFGQETEALLKQGRRRDF